VSSGVMVYSVVPLTRNMSLTSMLALLNEFTCNIAHNAALS
jgi:hypothetical protein